MRSNSSRWLTQAAFRELMRVVQPALAAADRITVGRQRRARVRHKPDGSEVTSADRGAERLLRRALRRAWPADGQLGEEYGGVLPARGRCWLIDPIDGTSSYVLGLPTFGTLLALVVDGEPVFGCIHLAALGETTYAARGHGCWLSRPGTRPRRVRVAAAPSLAEAQVGLTSFKDSDLAARRGRWRLSRLVRRVGRVRLVGDCVQYALLCRGLLDAGVDPRMHPWDIAALVPCVLEAGGACAALDGERTDVVHATSFAAASSSSLLTALCRTAAV